MKIRQFFVAKFKSSRLKNFGYNIHTDFKDLYYNDEIVQLADNQILRSIRRIKGVEIDFEEVDRLYKDKNRFANSKSKKGVEKKEMLRDAIGDILYIPEYITIKIEHKKHYEYLFENGVVINGNLYKRFSCSAGQSRVSTVVFVCETVHDELTKIIDNGRDLEKPLTPSKFNAYKGLAGSATFEVSTPKFCVVKDYFSNTEVEVDFVTETGFDEDDIISKKTINQEFNRFDGMGLITPKQSKKWAEELGLDYMPAQWCVRQSYLKGMVCTFDIHKFCKEKNDGNYIIDDVYGNKIDLRDIEVIITEGQFKLWDSFESLEYYNDNCIKNGLSWGVSLYTPKKDKDILKMNYQFLQTLDLNENDIKKVCSRFVNWIEGINGDNIHYILLFLMGINIDDESVKYYLNSSDNYWIKCLALDNGLIKDRYIRDKIYDLAKKKIHDACLGNIMVDGNYQVIVSDPYAMMEHVCGLDVKGLLDSGEYYSGYWNRKGVDRIDGMRAPMTGRSEHLLMDLKISDETEEWYKYCYTGIILNSHGSETMNLAGSDFDYDIIATTSEKTIIDGVYKNEIPVVYEPPKPEKMVLKERDLYNADLFGFGSIIGQITNKSTSAYAMLDTLKIGSPEYNILINRIKMCIKLQSAQIDKSKIGREVKGIPSLWKTFRKVKDDDTQDVKEHKEFYNKILLDKHPYFFRYLYKDTDRKYKKYIKKMNNRFKSSLGCTLDELYNKKTHTPEELQIIDRCNEFMPVIISDSVMNNICRYIEGINFDLKNKIKSLDIEDDYRVFMRYDNISKKLYKSVLNEYKNLKSKRVDYFFSDENMEDSSDLGVKVDGDTEFFRDRFLSLSNDVYEILDCLIYVYYVEYPKSNKHMLWNMFGKQIFDNVRDKTKTLRMPVLDEDGDLEYLGNKFKIKEVILDED